MPKLTQPTPEGVFFLEDGHGLRLTIAPHINGPAISISGPTDQGYILSNVAHIGTKAAPAVALAILKAAQFTPTARIEPSNWQESVEAAAGYLDDALFLAEKNTAAKAELTRRRDELANEFTAVATYNGQLPYVKNMLDRIIQLQDEATK